MTITIIIGVLTLLSMYLSYRWVKSDKFDIEAKTVFILSIVSLVGLLSTLILPNLTDQIASIQTSKNSSIQDILVNQKRNLSLDTVYSIQGLYHSSSVSLNRAIRNLEFRIDKSNYQCKEIATIIRFSDGNLVPIFFFKNIQSDIWKQTQAECILSEFDLKRLELEFKYNELKISVLSGDFESNCHTRISEYLGRLNQVLCMIEVFNGNKPDSHLCEKFKQCY